MARTGQLAVVFIALVLVLSAAGYGITKGLTAKDYSAYNACMRDWMRQGGDRPWAGQFAVCHDYLPN